MAVAPMTEEKSGPMFMPFVIPSRFRCSNLYTQNTEARIKVFSNAPFRSTQSSTDNYLPS